MAVQGVTLTVGTTAVEVSGANSDSVGGQSLLIMNNGTATLYLGGADVTTAQGYPLTAGREVAASLDAGERLYAIAGSAGNPLNVLRQGA